MRHFTIIVAILFLFSCNKSTGLIDERDNGCYPELKSSKRVFLVNRSRNKIFQFTCKITETLNDTGKIYKTIIRVLDPGDEIYLGCSETITEQLYNKKDTIELIEANEVGKSFQEIIDEEKRKQKDPRLQQLIEAKKRENKKQIYDSEKINNSSDKKGYSPFDDFNAKLRNSLPDTLINGKKMKYGVKSINDYTKKLPRVHSKFKYEVTGEVEIKVKTK